MWFSSPSAHRVNLQGWATLFRDTCIGLHVVAVLSLSQQTELIRTIWDAFGEGGGKKPVVPDQTVSSPGKQNTRRAVLWPGFARTAAITSKAPNPWLTGSVLPGSWVVRSPRVSGGSWPLYFSLQSFSAQVPLRLATWSRAGHLCLSRSQALWTSDPPPELTVVGVQWAQLALSGTEGMTGKPDGQGQGAGRDLTLPWPSETLFSLQPPT